MILDLCGIKVNYEISGQGKEVVLLHGWGANIQSLSPIIKYLEQNFKVIALDLPGFGKSQTPSQAWAVSDYALLVNQFLDALSIKNPILLGHSHGGRTIIYLTGKMKYKAHKIILVDSAGIKPKRKLKYYIKVYSFKLIKSLLKLPFFKSRYDELIGRAREKFGSSDYKSSQGVVRESMVKVLSEDLREYLPNIYAPTLLMWGEKDTATPLSDGKLMEKLIPDAGLVILKDAGHFSYLDRPVEFNTIIGNFLAKDIKA